MFASTKLFRAFSWAKKYEQKQIDKAAEDFKKEISFMASKNDYTLIDFKQRIIDHLAQSKKGLKSQLIGGDQKTEMELVNHRKIINALFDEELNNPELLTGTILLLS